MQSARWDHSGDSAAYISSLERLGDLDGRTGDLSNCGWGVVRRLEKIDLGLVYAECFPAGSVSVRWRDGGCVGELCLVWALDSIVRWFV